MQKFIAIGNVGQDPEVKLVGESKVANFSLATTERGFTKRDGTKVAERAKEFEQAPPSDDLPF